MSDCWWPHGLQHSRLPCSSLTLRACSNSCTLSWLCHPSISSSVIPFSSHLQSFPASGSFQMSQFFVSGGQSIRVSASASVLPMSIQDWFPLGLTPLNLLAVQGTFKSLLQHHSSKTSILRHSAFFIVQLSYPYMTSGKTTALTRWTFVGKSNVSAFKHAVYVGHNFSSKEYVSFNFMAAVTICSDFGASRKESLPLSPPFSHLFPMK